MKKKISIGDIARQLNVSKTTISLVLNGKARDNHISEQLVERVHNYVKSVDYKPNALAQGLRTGKTKIIGMLVEDISDPFFASIARMIEEGADKKGYKIIHSSTENNKERTKALIDIYRSRQVEGYIIAPPPGIEDDIRELIGDNLPVVLFDRYFPDLKTVNVVVDNFDATYYAMQHLVQNGYKEIAFISLVSVQNQMQERFRGYQKSVSERGASSYLNEVIFFDDHNKIVNQIQSFLQVNKNIDAVFFATNYLAEAGLEAIRNLGLCAPQQLGIVVFDDHNLFKLFSPSITAIEQPLKEISELIIELLLSKLSAGANEAEITTTVIPTTLNIRHSSSRLEYCNKHDFTK